jgi:hypothetical protein
MKNIYRNQQKRQQDTLRRIDQRLNKLEERIIALLSNVDFESMKPGERELATCRLLTSMLHLFALRQAHNRMALKYRPYLKEFGTL